MPYSDPCSSCLSWCSSQAACVERGLTALLVCVVVADAIYGVLFTWTTVPDRPFEGHMILLSPSEGFLYSITQCLTVTYYLGYVAVSLLVIVVGCTFPISEVSSAPCKAGQPMGSRGRAKRGGRHTLSRTRRETDRIHRKQGRYISRRVKTMGGCGRACMTCRFDVICNYVKPRGEWVPTRWIRSNLDPLGRKALDNMINNGWLEFSPCGRYCRAHSESESPVQAPMATNEDATSNQARDDSDVGGNDWDMNPGDDFVVEDIMPESESRDGCCCLPPSPEEEECPSESSWELCESPTLL